MNTNPSTLIDGYKVGHIHQYPEGTEIIASNGTARSTRRPNTNKVVFAGMQYPLKEYLIKQWNENFFSKPIEEVVHQFNRRINNYIVPNNVGDQHIRDLHKLGYLPIVILALPEGTEYPIKVPCFVIWNTDENFGWLTNYLETLLSASIWGPCTSATTAHQYKKLLMKYASETVGDTSFVQWQAHDFSFRGMFGLEAACMSGAAHLFSFTGTDTVPAIDFLEQYYNADCEKELIGGSVAATEHSVMCAGGNESVYVRESVSIEKVIENFREESPNLYKLASDIVSGKQKVEDGVYSSENTDNQKMVYNYFEVVGGEIVKIGDERIREGGWYWFKNNNNGETVNEKVSLVSGELNTFRRLIHNVYPTGIVSIVSDTWDYWNTITNIARELKDEIMGRDGKVVFRPDTGDPVKVVVGYSVEEIPDDYFEENATNFEINDTTEVVKYKNKFYPVRGNVVYTKEELSLPEVKGSIECLWDIFGGKVNAKGYKELDPHVGLIYGDSITLERASQICEGLKKKGFASTNIVFGVGSYTYQYVTRDTDGYAVKATFAKINGVDKEIFKSPKGASFKKSAKGLTAVFKDENGEFYLKDQATWDEVNNCEFVKVFENGKLMKDYTLQEVRDNLKQYL